MPVVAAITDLAAMHYWASRGVDVHLVTHPESIEEVREVAGHATTVATVHGFSLPEFRRARTQADARVHLDLPADGKVVLVSGGGWGVGDVEGAVGAALTLDDVVASSACAGATTSSVRGSRAAFGGDPRVRVEGFTERCRSGWLRPTRSSTRRAA